MSVNTNGLVDQRTDISMASLRKFASMLTDKEFSEAVWEIATSNFTEDGLVKKASYTKFAFPEANMFPVDTENDAIISKVYFEAQREKIAENLADRISAKLDTYLDLYGVPSSFEMHMSKVASSTDFRPRHLIPSVGLFKVAMVQDLDAAYQEFSSAIGEYSVPERVEFCKEFAKVATTIRSQELPPLVQRYCGMMDSDLDNVRALLGIRKVAASREGKSGDEYAKLATSLQGVEDATPEELEKLADYILGLDAVYGFTQPKYDKKMPDAYATVFNKQAAAPDEDSLKGEASLTKAEIIAKYGPEALDALEDPEGNVDQEKLKQVMATTGREDNQ